MLESEVLRAGDQDWEMHVCGGGEQELARTHKHILEPHKNGLKPVLNLVAFETGAMGIMQSFFAMELNIFLAQELEKLKEDPGESGACLCFMPTR